MDNKNKNNNLTITRVQDFDIDTVFNSWSVLSERALDFDHELVAKMIKMEILLFQRAECIYGDLSFENTRKYANFVLSWLIFYRKRGFVTEKDRSFINNPLFEIMIECFGLDKNKRNELFVLEHMCNMFILSVLRNLYMTWQSGDKPLQEMNNDEDEEAGEILVLINLFKNILSPGLRNSIIKNRIRVEERVYTGFDTEYTNVEYARNELLCATTSTFTKTFFILTYLRSEFDLDFKTSGNYSNASALPYYVSSSIYLNILAIRHIGGRADASIDSLIYHLSESGPSNDLEVYKERDKVLITIKKDINVKNFVSVYKDFSSTSDDYSLKWLINSCFHTSKDLRTKELTELLLRVSKIASASSINFVYNIQKLKIFIKIGNSNELVIRRKSSFILIAHLTIADICSWSDYEVIKEEFDIIQKSVVTRQRPISYNSVSIILRDTMLLSVGTGSSLSALGKLYKEEGGPEKINIDPKWYTQMSLFKESEPELFKSYAQNDAIVSLFHALKVEESNFKLNQKFAIPVSLGSMAGNYITSHVDFDRYEIPSLNRIYTVQDISLVYTPKGVELSGFSHYLFYFLGSYHGGRNESFIYGTYFGTVHDYDLPGAYSTAMSLLGIPNYENIKYISEMDDSSFDDLYWGDLLYSYTSLQVKFKFPKSVRYPNLPVRLDRSSIIFPLTGEAYITGLEYRLAKRLGCTITILGGCIIPFRQRAPKTVSVIQKEELALEGEWIKLSKLIRQMGDSQGPKIAPKPKSKPGHWKWKYDSKDSKDSNDKEVYIRFDDSHGYKDQSFYRLVKHLTIERGKHQKGTYYNLLYKLLANAGIGQFGRGLSRKMQYSPRLDSTTVVGAGPLSNPLLGGWITGFIRCVLSEILNDLDPEIVVVSCTTDGFITNKNLDDYKHKGEFARIYITARKNLSKRSLGTEAKLLEKKYTDEKGVISWSTRGQVGLAGEIKATTGLRTSRENAVKIVTEAFSSPDKSVSYLSTSLRSPNAIYKDGGMVTQEFQENVFMPVYDNRREINLSDNDSLSLSLSLSEYNEFNPLTKFLYTKPFMSMKDCLLSRQLSKLTTRKYSEYAALESDNLKTDTYIGLAVRMFIRICYSRPDILGLNKPLKRKDIFEVLENLDVVKVPNYISKQKSYVFMERSIPKVPSTISFVEKIKNIYPYFKEDIFYKE